MDHADDTYVEVPVLAHELVQDHRRAGERLFRGEISRPLLIFLSESIRGAHVLEFKLRRRTQAEDAGNLSKIPIISEPDHRWHQDLKRDNGGKKPEKHFPH